MPEYKLTYSEARGLAEPIRLIFAYAKVEYQDIRLKMTPQNPLTDEWRKELGLPWGQIPILEIDGKIYGQSVAIARYLARKYKLAGADEFEELKCDEIVDALKDYAMKFNALYPFLRDPNSDPAKKAELLKNITEVETPAHLGRFNALLENSPSGFFVGTGLTWADIMATASLTSLQAAFEVKLLKEFPALQKLVEKVENAPGIKEWIEKRPYSRF